MKKKNMIMRKALSIITSIAIVATMSMPVTFAAESRWTGSGTSDSPYQISSQADLEAINTGLSENNDYTNVYFQITDNINLDSSWTGIGSPTIASADTNSPYVSGGTGFAGILDGNGKTVTVNRSISSAPATNTAIGGVINYLEPTGILKNMTVDSTASYGVTVASGAATTVAAVGAVVGYNSGIIEHVTNKAAVSASDCYNVGGISGFNDCYYSDMAKGIITDCSNEATVSGYAKVGGITGENSGTVNACSNTAGITGTSTGRAGVGGIVGRNGNNGNAVEAGVIANCYNTKAITCTDGSWVGGICGFNNSLSKVVYCYDTGSMYGRSYTDPICGGNEGAKVTTCYYPDDIDMVGVQGYDGANEMSEADMKLASFVNTLNGDTTTTNSIWQQKSSDYPVLLANGNATSVDMGFTIEKSGSPTTTYQAGQTFSTEGLTVQAVSTSSTGTTVPVTGFTVTPARALTSTDRNAHVYGVYKGVAYSFPFAITVTGTTTSTIYLSNTGDDSNAGTTTDTAVKTLGKAVELIGNGTGTILVKNTITIGDGRVFGNLDSDDNPLITVKAADGAIGSSMFNVTGTAYIGSLKFDGTGFENTFSVPGTLAIRNNAVVSGSNTAFNVTSTGSLTLNRSNITGTQYSVKVATGGYFEIGVASTQTFAMSGKVYLDNDTKIVFSDPVPCDLTVETVGAEAGRVIAVGNNYIMTTDDADKISYAGDDFHVALNTNNQLALVQNIILDGTRSTNGSGTLESPYNNLNSALNAASTGDIIVVVGTTNLTATPSSKEVTIQRGTNMTNTMFNVNGDVTLSGMTINGGGIGTIVNVASGSLTLNDGVTLTDCNTAVNLAGGKLTLNKAVIQASQYSINMTTTAERFDLIPQSGTEISGAIYLADRQTITVGSSLAVVTGTIQVTSETTASSTIIARCSTPAMATESATKLIINGVLSRASSNTIVIR